MREKAGVVVSVVMGSDSDLPVMEESVKVLEAFAIPHELFLTSAHRTPERTAQFARGAAKREIGRAHV
jgi:phosphoribosylcarboxyaminoimidazole (NCAIR) mutase